MDVELPLHAVKEGGVMRKLVAALAIVGATIGLAAPAVSHASTTAVKIPAVCVQRTIAKAHIQVGYCP
jgi:hypothetical protein